MYAFYILAILLAAVTAYTHSDFGIKQKLGRGFSANAFIATHKATRKSVVLKIAHDSSRNFILENELEVMQV
jgi:hypothetical protein